MQRARESFHAGKFHDAVALCNKGLHINEEDALASTRLYNNRAISYQNLGQYMPAIADCSRAIRLRPSAWQPVHNRYLAYRDIGAAKEALQVSCPAHFCICQADCVVLRCSCKLTLPMPFLCSPLHSIPHQCIPSHPRPTPPLAFHPNPSNPIPSQLPHPAQCLLTTQCKVFNCIRFAGCRVGPAPGLS